MHLYHCSTLLENDHTQPATLWFRVTFIEYYTKYLAKAAALLAAQAPVSAMRLFDREHQNIHEIVQWASTMPPEEALPFYSDILWDSMPLLSGRLDLMQREVFCKVCLLCCCTNESNGCCVV